MNKINNYIDALNAVMTLIATDHANDNNIDTWANVLFNKIMEHSNPELAANHVITTVLNALKPEIDRITCGYNMEHSSMMEYRYKLLLSLIGERLGKLKVPVDNKTKEFLLSIITMPQPEGTEAPQQANNGSIEEMAGHKKRTKPEPQQLPQELSTQEAKAYFKKAIELGLMDKTYKWLKGLQMMACFAVEMSNKLNLGKGTLADGRKRISWKPFEILFNIEHGKLRLNYNDVQKTGKTPNEMNLIYKVFE